MCVVSNAVDQWTPHVFPAPSTFPELPKITPVPQQQGRPYQFYLHQVLAANPQPAPAASPAVDPELAKLMLKALEILDRIDKKLGLRDCSNSEPQKASFIHALNQLAEQSTETTGT